MAAGDLNDYNLKTSLSTVFHGGDAISVVGYEHNPVDCVRIGKEGDIQTYAHVNAFLLKIHFKIGVLKRSARGDRNILGLVSTELQYPAPHGEQVFAREFT